MAATQQPEATISMSPRRFEQNIRVSSLHVYSPQSRIAENLFEDEGSVAYNNKTPDRIARAMDALHTPEKQRGHHENWDKITWAPKKPFYRRPFERPAQRSIRIEDIMDATQEAEATISMSPRRFEHNIHVSSLQEYSPQLRTAENLFEDEESVVYNNNTPDRIVRAMDALHTPEKRREHQENWDKITWAPKKPYYRRPFERPDHPPKPLRL